MRRKQTALFLVLIMVTSLFLTPLSMAASKAANFTDVVTDQGAKPAYVEGEVIVKFKPVLAKMQTNSIKENLALRTTEYFPLTGSEIAKIENGKSVPEVVRELSKNPDVLYAQPNYLYYSQAVAPNDTYFSDLWGLNNTGQTVNTKAGVNDVDIDGLEAWDLHQGSSTIVVAVIDEGVDINHPDLTGRIWTNPGEIPGNLIDDDGNTYVDDVNGWDFYNNENTVFDAKDLDQHGTHVAGTIAAVANNATGIAGVAPNVKIMPLKFIGPNGGSTANAIKAIQYATNKGVKISNNSWGQVGTDLALKAAIDSSGQVFVAAAGNDTANVDNAPSYSPAGLSSANIITVAAVYNQGGLASFSNYGLTTVDVGAPGQDIYSLKPVYPAMGAALQIHDTTFNYKAVHFGFGLEDIASDANRAAVMQRALNFLDTNTSTPILLVDDDNDSPDYFPKIQAALAGYNVAGVVYAGNTVDGPTSAAMAGKTVIWFTGDAIGDVSNKPLKVNDLANLKTFLDGGGGKLLLIGEDIALRNEQDELFTVYMEEKVINDFTPNTTVMDAVYSYTYALPASPDRDTLVPAGISVPMYNYIASDPATSYQYKDGTSMAAPHVAGIAALMLSINPSLTPTQVVDLLKHPQNVDPLATLSGKTVTGGMANAYKAVLAAKVPAVPTGLIATPGNQTVQLNWTAVSDADLAGYNIYRNGVKINGALVTGISYTDATGLTNGTTYGYDTSAVDTFGFESARTAVVNATPYLPQVAPTLTVTGKTAAKNGAALQFGGTTTVGATVYSAKLEQLDAGGALIPSTDINVTSNVTISGGNIGGGYSVPSFNAATKSVRLNLTVDISGTKYSATSAPFTVDTTPPAITVKLPLENATNVSVLNNLEITFSEPMDASTINNTNITLTSAVYGPATITVSYDSTNKKAVIDPASSLKYLIQYTITVSAGVYDPAGNDVTGSPISWNFTTEADTYPPEIVPQIASTNVPIDSLITFGFNEEVVASTVYNAIYNNQILLKKGAETVTATVEYNSTTKIVTIRPSASLSNNTTYTVSVAGVSDFLNNMIVTPRTWNFTTVALSSSGGSTIEPSAPIKVEKEITPTLGADITVGDFRVHIPSGLNIQNLKVLVETKQLGADDAKEFKPLKAFELTFKTVTGNREVTTLQKPITIKFNYTPLELGSAPVGKLGIYYKQSLSDKYWIPVKSKIDTAKGEVAAEVNHATIFALLVDTTAPNAPVLEQIPATTTKRVLTIKGQVEPYASAQIFSNGRLIGSKETSGNGSFMLDVLLPAGENKITAKAVDSAGNISNSTAQTMVDVNPAVSVKDIKDHWAELTVQKLMENGNLTGFPDNTFRPEYRVTRAEFTVMVIKGLGMEIQPYKEQLKFADNDKIPTWAQSYIGIAVDKGIIKGDAKNNFRPSDLITREEMAVIIVQALKSVGALSEQATKEIVYIDKNNIGTWALAAVTTAVQKGIIAGYADNSFRPKNKASRAEAAAMIHKLMETK